MFWFSDLLNKLFSGPNDRMEKHAARLKEIRRARDKKFPGYGLPKYRVSGRKLTPFQPNEVEIADYFGPTVDVNIHGPVEVDVGSADYYHEKYLSTGRMEDFDMWHSLFTKELRDKELKPPEPVIRPLETRIKTAEEAMNYDVQAQVRQELNEQSAYEEHLNKLALRRRARVLNYPKRH